MLKSLQLRWSTYRCLSLVIAQKLGWEEAIMKNVGLPFEIQRQLGLDIPLRAIENGYALDMIHSGSVTEELVGKALEGSQQFDGQIGRMC